jgi:hypothetical protein
MAESPPKVSKPFIVIAGIGLVVIVAFLAMKVLGGGGGGSDSASSASTAATAAAGAPSASTTTTTAPGEPSTPNQSFDVFTTKNPFQPLVTESASSGFDESTTTQTSPPLDNSGDATVPPIIPQEQAPAAGTPVSVLEVSSATGATVARVQVGSTVYTVAVGDTFATSYRVVSLDAGTGCGQFQYGDTPFELCTGQQTLK